MDLKTIQRINRDALDAALESQGKSSSDDKEMTMYLVALASAVVAYFLFQYYQPEFVLTVQNGVRVFDKTRALIASVVVGLLVLLGYNLFSKN